MKMAEAISSNNSRVLWDEARKMSKTNNSLPNMMDGYTSTNEIADIFSTKYNTLYNSVGYASYDMDHLKKDIEERIARNLPSQARIITVKQVKDAIDYLKSDKKEENGLYSNHFKYGTERLCIQTKQSSK